MTAPESVYQYPRYYAIGYQWNTSAECQFLEACFAAHLKRKASRILDIGCGAGRHMLELATRGYRVSGLDLRPEMVTFVQEASRKTNLPVEVSVGDLRDLSLTGSFDAAICLMDTFRFLQTNAQIITHLQRVAASLAPEGLYVTDF